MRRSPACSTSCGSSPGASTSASAAGRPCRARCIAVNVSQRRGQPPGRNHRANTGNSRTAEIAETSNQAELCFREQCGDRCGRRRDSRRASRSVRVLRRNEQRARGPARQRIRQHVDGRDTPARRRQEHRVAPRSAGNVRGGCTCWRVQQVAGHRRGHQGRVNPFQVGVRVPQPPDPAPSNRLISGEFGAARPGCPAPPADRVPPATRRPPVPSGPFPATCTSSPRGGSSWVRAGNSASGMFTASAWGAVRASAAGRGSSHLRQTSAARAMLFPGQACGALRQQPAPSWPCQQRHKRVNIAEVHAAGRRFTSPFMMLQPRYRLLIAGRIAERQHKGVDVAKVH